ncbi:MAG: heavy metal-binding domain-containing protein [Lachnospiraceae bacterium]|nr:heavy metal-binding domain-containing protein [Lachnospiraceae bacterium]
MPNYFIVKEKDMILTTGHNLEGYVITEYIDVIFDELLVGIGFKKGLTSTIDNVISSFTGTEATEMIERLNMVKAALKYRVIRKAENLGANALIGVDFESSRLGELLMVSMTATAVKIETLADYSPETVESKQRLIEEEKERTERLRKAEEQRLEGEQKRAAERRKEDEFFASFGITEELSSTERSLFKAIHRNENIDIIGISRMIPRNMTQSDVIEALQRLLDMGAIIVEDECYRVKDMEEE